ncbi:hypothetical protein HM002_05240 [Candidatus Bathyarchaeota archaeon A05DMB-4]|nr:hypothetical protein [Candidatus Bathyarchaeota archaeon A05DMB-4]
MVSFPPLTKMLQFRGFPLHRWSVTVPEGTATRSLIRASSVLRLHASTRGFSQLAAPFFSAQALPSARRRSMSSFTPVSD